MKEVEVSVVGGPPANARLIQQLQLPNFGGAQTEDAPSGGSHASASQEDVSSSHAAASETSEEVSEASVSEVSNPAPASPAPASPAPAPSEPTEADLFLEVVERVAAFSKDYGQYV